MVSLGNRMKEYEKSTSFKIISRVPVIIRIDGKSFSNLTKRLKLEKPYDKSFSSWMAITLCKIAAEISGCVLGYTQSDEMTLIIRSDQTLETEPWFGNRIQKMASVSASIASAYFNLCLPPKLDLDEKIMIDEFNMPIMEKAFFDARVFPVPNMIEAVNNLIWRQQDCVKNSISSACYYEIGKKLGLGTARKLIHKLNQTERADLLLREALINWEDYQDEFKYGIAVYKKTFEVETENGKAIRKKWIFEAAPIFNSEIGRKFLQETMNPKVENGKEGQEV